MSSPRVSDCVGHALVARQAAPLEEIERWLGLADWAERFEVLAIDQDAYAELADCQLWWWLANHFDEMVGEGEEALLGPEKLEDVLERLAELKSAHPRLRCVPVVDGLIRLTQEAIGRGVPLGLFFF